MKRVRIVTALATSALLSTTIAVSPAAAAGSQASFCDPLSDPAGAISPTGGAFQGRGGVVREPDLGEVHQDLPASAKGKAGKRFSATVPVYFHVITDGAVGNVTNAQIADQIKVLDNTYAAGEGGADTGFSFVLAGVTRTDNARWFYSNPGGVGEHEMKRTLHSGGDNALNWYSTTAGDYLGWSYLPDITTKPGQEYLDGVVVDWESMRGTSTKYAGEFDQGETGTHEVGHWLNLEHTFFGQCNKSGDFVADTPAEKSAAFGCPTGRDTCRNKAGLDPIKNFMDYTYDSCMNRFSAGQVTRMDSQGLTYR